MTGSGDQQGAVQPLCVDSIEGVNCSSGKEGSSLLSQTRYEHIILNEAHVPVIAGTTMKVIELVLDHLAYGWSPEELHFQHPHLTLGQIHSALAYYWDHKAELDQDIERRLQVVDQLQQSIPSNSLAERLKARRRL